MKRLAVKLVFLGRIEDLAGCESAALLFEQVGDVAVSWSALIARLKQEYGASLADYIESERVKVAVNGSLIAEKQSLFVAHDDEVAFLPPVSGG